MNNYIYKANIHQIGFKNNLLILKYYCQEKIVESQVLNKYLINQNWHIKIINSKINLKKILVKLKIREGQGILDKVLIIFNLKKAIIRQ